MIKENHVKLLFIFYKYMSIPCNYLNNYRTNFQIINLKKYNYKDLSTK